MKLTPLFASVVGVIAVIGVPGLARADEPAVLAPKLEDAIQRASAEGKPLLLEFYTTWCGPCKEFEKTTLVDPKVQDALRSVVWVRYDAEAEPGLAAATRYLVSGYPTFLAVDSHGVERKREMGANTGDKGVHDFLAVIAGAAEATIDEPAVRARLKSHPSDPAIQLSSAHWFASRGMPSDAIAAYQAAATNPAATREQRAEAATAGPRLRRLSQWKQQLIAEKQAIIREHPELASDTDLAIAALGSPAAHELAGKALRAQTDPDALNNLIYTALAVGAVDEAIEAGNRMVGDRKDADRLDTLAECYHARGDRDAALRIEDEALAIAKHNLADLKANRARFDTGSEESPGAHQVRARVAAVWTALDQAEAASPPAVPSPQFAEVQAFMSALRKLGEQAATSCATAAGKSPLAYAKLTIGPDHHVQSSLILLDGNAPAALRPCLNKFFVGQSLPAIELRVPTEVQISFDKSAPH